MNESWPIERAAGGVVMRDRNGILEVLLIDDAYGHVTFPKGHVEAGETWEDAAIREIQEETGIEARILAPLGRVEYQIERNGQPIRKQVRLFLLQTIDESDEPQHQVEEVRGAYFTPYSEALTLHERSGYANWSWILPKAGVLWDWHEQQLDSAWRLLSADTAWETLVQSWRQSEPVVRRLISVVRHELGIVAPDISKRLDEREAAHTAQLLALQETLPPAFDFLSPRPLPVTLGDEGDALHRAIEHTLLKPEASQLDIENLAREAMSHRFAGVCVNPQYAATIANAVSGTKVIPCAVVGFPFGAQDLNGLVGETRAVIERGVQEVDMVIPVGSLREDDVWTVFRYMVAVTEAAHALKAKVKVILEAHFLSPDQLVKGSLLTLAAGADFVKTSTGFAASGARIADVAMMRATVGQHCGVKAAGGLRTRNQALAFLRFGANRLGTSSGVLMVR